MKILAIITLLQMQLALSTSGGFGANAKDDGMNFWDTISQI